MLKSLIVKRSYRTKKDDLVRDFYGPCLRASVSFDRGVGYFTLASLTQIFDGLIPFFNKHGIIRLITSVQMSEDDLQLIKLGYKKKEKVIESILLEELNRKLAETQVITMEDVSDLIASGRLIIKIAVVDDGLYHEKIGIFKDEDNNAIYFMGSANETLHGQVFNRESISVFCSWNEFDRYEVEQQINYFEMLWENEDPVVEVYKFPEAVKNKILKEYKKTISPPKDDNIKVKKISLQHGRFPLRDYQEEAINNFIFHKSYFFEMATGTGKTYTAIAACKRLIKKERLLILVLVPQIDLQEQWASEFNSEGLETTLFGGFGKGDITDVSIRFKSLPNDSIICISTYDTFFQKLSKKFLRFRDELLLIVDEAHNLTANHVSLLPISPKYALGLSATPERYRKDETKKILSYFLKEDVTSFVYDLEKAIENGYLSRYEYEMIFAYLTEDEFEEYRELSKDLAALLNQDEPDKEKIESVSNRRALIIKKATNKLDVLNTFVKDGSLDFKNSVVYCGQGKDTETENHIINEVTKILSQNQNYFVSQFTSKTKDRKLVLDAFKDDDYDVLIAIKCFDEGIDVPKLSKLFIMSSDGNLRQTVQRRGRVLRASKETGKDIAMIYDFVILPPKRLIISDLTAMHSVLKRELKRAFEYSRLAENKNKNIEIIKDVMNSYQLAYREVFGNGED